MRLPMRVYARPDQRTSSSLGCKVTRGLFAVVVMKGRSSGGEREAVEGGLEEMLEECGGRCEGGVGTREAMVEGERREGGVKRRRLG